MKPCRECRHSISEQAIVCPSCGAPYPAKEKWDGWGYEYKSKTELLGLPLLHISFKYRPNRMPVPARGVIAIGQFSAGIFLYISVQHRPVQPEPVHRIDVRHHPVRYRLVSDRAAWAVC
jgi:hypothetical protein